MNKIQRFKPKAADTLAIDPSSAKRMWWVPLCPRRLKSAGLLLLLMISQSASGEGLRVSPLKLEFDKDSNSALVKISNGAPFGHTPYFVLNF